MNPWRKSIEQYYKKKVELASEKIYSNPEEKLNAFIMYSIKELYSIDEVAPRGF